MISIPLSAINGIFSVAVALSMMGLMTENTGFRNWYRLFASIGFFLAVLLHSYQDLVHLHKYAGAVYILVIAGMALMLWGIWATIQKLRVIAPAATEGPL